MFKVQQNGKKQKSYSEFQGLVVKRKPSNLQDHAGFGGEKKFFSLNCYNFRDNCALKQGQGMIFSFTKFTFTPRHNYLLLPPAIYQRSHIQSPR